MKYIITEEQNNRLRIIRRLPQYMEYICKMPPYKNPCGSVRHESHYLDLLEEWFFETIPFEWYEELNDDKKLFWETIMQVYGDKIKNNFSKKCKQK